MDGNYGEQQGKERRTGRSKERYEWKLCGVISERKGDWTGTEGGRKERQIEQ
jgi:hypothetical protein